MTRTRRALPLAVAVVALAVAVGSMAILSVYLRQRGSPGSKPVGSPHDATGVEG